MFWFDPEFVGICAGAANSEKKGGHDPRETHIQVPFQSGDGEFRGPGEPTKAAGGATCISKDAIW